MKINDVFETQTRRKEVQFDKGKFFRNCATAIEQYKNGVVLYRGLKKPKDSLTYSDSTKSVRASAFAKSNQYTIWVDNHPSWKDFPKRSRSFICSTNYHTARHFGIPHIVFPIGDPKFGICPVSDFQLSFPYAYKNYNFGVLSLNNQISSLVDQYSEKIYHTYDELLKALAELQKRYDDLKDRGLIKAWLSKEPKKQEQAFDLMSPEERRFTHQLVDPNSNGGIFQVNHSIFDSLSYALDPYKNGFKIEDFSEMKFLDNKEVWFSGKAYFVSMKSELYQTLKNELR